MQATTLGPNLTGAAVSPSAVDAMNDAADALTPAMGIDRSEMKAQKMRFIAEAEAIGSVPRPPSIKGMITAGAALLQGSEPTLFIDKLGERLAYERTGVRLYEALILKYRAVEQTTGEPLPDAVPPQASGTQGAAESPTETLERIRSEELAHFSLLRSAMEKLGGDPTAQTPCADVIAVAASGFMQVLNDPRTTLAQCLNAMLAVELADNAGWELLADLAEDAGQDDMARQFLDALAQEQEHLVIVKGWLRAIMHDDPKPALV